MRDGESELMWHNQSPHGVILSNRKLCQESQLLQATGPGKMEERRVDRRQARNTEMQKSKTKAHRQVTLGSEKESEEFNLPSSSVFGS